jgi:hypothetical protein
LTYIDEFQEEIGVSYSNIGDISKRRQIKGVVMSDQNEVYEKLAEKFSRKGSSEYMEQLEATMTPRLYLSTIPSRYGY